MIGELKSGAVIEVQVGKCVFVGIVVAADGLNIEVEMDGRLKVGTLVSICDPEAVCATVQGKVFECRAKESGGFCLHVARTQMEAAVLERLFVWPPHAMKYARI